jgi:predicted lactoylglutathione lyase
MMLVNLPVADVERSRRFFADLGYAFDDRFSGEKAVTLVLGENQFAMLLQREAFDALHPLETADATKVKECVVCLTVDSRDAVDALVDRALAAGGTEGDAEDHGSMYGRSYNDLDGHSWQIFWADDMA